MKYKLFLRGEAHEPTENFSQVVEKIYKWLQETTTYIRLSPKFKHPAGAVSWYGESAYPFADSICIDSEEILEHVLSEPFKYGSEGLTILLPSCRAVAFIEIEE